MSLRFTCKDQTQGGSYSSTCSILTADEMNDTCANLMDSETPCHDCLACETAECMSLGPFGKKNKWTLKDSEVQYHKLCPVPGYSFPRVLCAELRARCSHWLEWTELLLNLDACSCLCFCLKNVPEARGFRKAINKLVVSAKDTRSGIFVEVMAYRLSFPVTRKGLSGWAYGNCDTTMQPA